MPDPVSEVLQTLSTPPYDSGRLLLTGWFSFLDGEVTVGDLMAQRQVSLALGQAGVVHDTAWSAGFRPGAMTLDDADPAWYGRLLFVGGPAHGEQILALHRRFARCRRLAVNVTVVDRRDPAVTAFDHVVARDGVPGEPRLDLSATAPLGWEPPVAGVMLTDGQGEYGVLRRHADVNDHLLTWLGQKDCARVAADTRLATDDWRHCATAEQFMALAAKSTLSSPAACTAWCCPCAPELRSSLWTPSTAAPSLRPGARTALAGPRRGRRRVTCRAGHLVVLVSVPRRQRGRRAPGTPAARESSADAPGTVTTVLNHGWVPCPEAAEVRCAGPDGEYDAPRVRRSRR